MVFYEKVLKTLGSMFWEYVWIFWQWTYFIVSMMFWITGIVEELKKNNTGHRV